MRIGDKIKVLLDRRGMTQRELAKRIGITEVSMSRYVCNARIPKGPLIAAMAKALGVSADELLGLAEGPVISDDKPPSAQPEKEKAKRVLWTGWKGHRDTRYKCPNCKKPVKNDDIYCHRCGQKLMFPHISFTDYVPGEKQETIVRWDDE